MKTDQEFQDCAERLKALADPDRLRIVICLLDEERNVGAIAESIGEEITKVSHHFGVLRKANIVSTKREGRFIIYRLHPKMIPNDGRSDHSRSIEFGCCRVDLTDAMLRKCD